MNAISFIKKAKQFAHDAHDSIGQVRKYSGLPYWVHTDETDEILSTVTDNPYRRAAMNLHDVLEDVFPINPYYSPKLIQNTFGIIVLDYTIDLTDVFTPENYPDMNRAQRKEGEAQRLSQVCANSQTHKYCDLISNTADIAKHDAGFAKIYIQEKKRILELMNKGDATLYKRAMDQIYSFEV